VNAQCEFFIFNTHPSAGIANSNPASGAEFSLCSFLLNCADASLTMKGLMPHAKRPKDCANNVLGASLYVLPVQRLQPIIHIYVTQALKSININMFHDNS
jgi:hypothetical protein